MKISILLLFLFFVIKLSFGTVIPSDRLIYNDDTLHVYYSWWPTILETYYSQNKLEYNLPRGYHSYNKPIATALWKIENDKLYLTSIVIKDSIVNPIDYGISSKTESDSQNVKVFADWFTGIINCHNYKFKVRNGIVITGVYYNAEDERLLNNGVDYYIKNSTSKQKSEALLENYNYISFYFNLRQDTILYKDTVWELIASERIYNPIFSCYENGFTNWTYNWENREKSGAPSCKWIVKNDSLFLSDILLLQKFKFQAQIDTLNFNEVFQKNESNNSLYLDCVSGVFLLWNESNIQKKKFLKKRIDIYTSYYIKVVDGIIVDSARKSYHLYNKSIFYIDEYEYTNEKLEKLINEYNSL